MADKKLYYDKIYGLVMQCRKSGLSDKQWCINNDIAPSTFYWWIKKLRQQACYEIPEHSFKCNTNIVTEKQDVVCVNVLPEAAENITLFADENDTQMAPIMFKYKNASITLQDDFNEHTLKRLLTVLQEVSCQGIYLLWTMFTQSVAYPQHIFILSFYLLVCYFSISGKKDKDKNIPLNHNRTIGGGLL